jgi:hypothetical protein
MTLLRALPPGAVAVKFTTTEDVFERCPRGTPCVVCGIDVPYRIIEDPRVLGEAGTDTARLAEAGAARVLWTIAKQSAIVEAWAAVQACLAPENVVIMEGSTIVDLSRPDLVLFVAHPFLCPSRWKPTTAGLLRRADTVIVNVPAAERRLPSLAVTAEIERHRGGRGFRRADVARPLSEWAPDLVMRLSGLARGAEAAHA